MAGILQPLPEFGQQGFGLDFHPGFPFQPLPHLVKIVFTLLKLFAQGEVAFFDQGLI